MQVNLLTGKFSVDSRTNNLSIPRATLSNALRRKNIKQNIFSELCILVRNLYVTGFYFKKCYWTIQRISLHIPLVHFFFRHNVTWNCFAGNKRKSGKNWWLSLTVTFWSKWASWPYYNKLFVPVPEFIARSDQKIIIMTMMMIMTRVRMKIWTKGENDWQWQEQQKTCFSKTIFASPTKVLFDLRPIPPWKVNLWFPSSHQNF